jgi:hypothetical protein
MSEEESSTEQGHVYLVEVEWQGPEGGDAIVWTSAHRSYAGAATRLDEHAIEVGIDPIVLDLDSEGFGFRQWDDGCGVEFTYGIKRLPVQD